ncbi:hypothetical protein EW145_g289 [Phellinidium pouzarii]|uniref:DNA (cytosine-5-)-methyltransferase n=1 Tax=Phellinidium pouzarii TaxID=167371 RepID=A0A4S4LKV7_9AGAM|nr:hypothetical protein EW145_g289 [Phellinidium pouzarii]
MPTARSSPRKRPINRVSISSRSKRLRSTSPEMGLTSVLFSNDDFYKAEDDECAEDDFYVADENIPAFDPNKLPVRHLMSYTIYDLETGQILPLPPFGRTCGASGRVRPEFEGGAIDTQDDDSDLDDPATSSQQVVRLSKIMEMFLDTENFVEPEIWIRTAIAWYILDDPSQSYRPYLNCIYVPHLLTCILAANHCSPDCSDQEVIDVLDYSSKDGVYAACKHLIGSNILDSIILNLPFIILITKEVEVRENLKALDETKLSKRSKNLIRNKAIDHTPFVTATISKIAQGLFYRILAITEDNALENPSLENICVAKDPFVVHKDDPVKIKWGNQIPGVRDYYQSVYLDGVEYSVIVGDAVAVEPGRDANRRREANSFLESARTKNELGNQAWFCTILYFFGEKTGDKIQKLFHGRWFQHGSQTILAETANPQGLFLLDQCDSNPVSSIIQKIEIRQLNADDTEPIVLAEQDVGSSTFHFSFKWKEEQFSFSSPIFDEEDELVALLCPEKHRACYPCVLRYQRDLLSNCIKTTSSIDFCGQCYHLHDFVYVKSNRDLLRIAQITDLMPASGNAEIKVSIYDRSSGTQKPTDERMLFPTDKSRIISASSLDGHCYVEMESKIVDLASWVQNSDCFIIPGHLSKRFKLRQCETCSAAREAWAEAKEFVVKDRLKALDIFSGAGGLSTGMELSGFVKTCWAVELSRGAASSLKTNHPEVEVYNQDCNALLKHAVEQRAGKNPEPLQSLDDISGRQQLPPLPQPGKVDLIMGGPPCQAFSGMNRYKKADDVRPKYVLIENVMGLLYFRLQGKQRGQKIVGGIESGMVKFILRAFTSLGYQVQIKVLNAADYGSPQQRNRVIFWAAQLGVPLPRWPTPTHIPRNGHNHTVRKVASGNIPLASRQSLDSEGGHRHAPFYSVTVLEAIDDLASPHDLDY